MDESHTGRPVMKLTKQYGYRISQGTGKTWSNLLILTVGVVIQPPAEKQYSEYFLYFLSAQPPAKVNSCIIFDPALRIYLLCILLPYFSQSKTPISKPINRRPALLQNMLQRRVRLQRQPQRPFARPIQMPRIP